MKFIRTSTCKIYQPLNSLGARTNLCDGASIRAVFTGISGNGECSSYDSYNTTLSWGTHNPNGTFDTTWSGCAKRITYASGATQPVWYEGCPAVTELQTFTASTWALGLGTSNTFVIEAKVGNFTVFAKVLSLCDFQFGTSYSNDYTAMGQYLGSPYNFGITDSFGYGGTATISLL